MCRILFEEPDRGVNLLKHYQSRIEDALIFGVKLPLLLGWQDATNYFSKNS